MWMVIKEHLGAVFPLYTKCDMTSFSGRIMKDTASCQSQEMLQISSMSQNFICK